MNFTFWRKKNKITDALNWAYAKKCERWSDKTKSDFRCVLNYFLSTVEDIGISNNDIKTLTRVTMREILDRMVKGRELGDHAYLKYKAFMFGMFKVLKDWEKIDFNPCDFTAPMKNPDVKPKVKLTEDQRIEVRDRILDRCPCYWNYLMILYYCQIRPKEIFTIKIKDINLEKNEIKIWGENSKNNKDRIAIIPNKLDIYFKEMDLDRYPGHWYLFGWNFFPEERISPVKRDRSTKLWNKLIKNPITGLGIESNQYYLKHSGLTDKRDAKIEPEAAQFQSGHSDYETTQKNYIDLDRPEIRRQLRELTTDFIINKTG